MIVQFFLIRRYHRLARQQIITWVLSGLSLAALGAATTVSIKISTRDEYDSRNSVFIPVTLWFSLAVATDLSIAMALVYQLQRMKSGFKSSEGLVKRISYVAISSGLVTSSLAILTLLFYWGYMTTNIPAFFGFFMASTNHLTMLYNLNKRNSLAGSDPTSFGSPSAVFRGESGSLGLNLTNVLQSPRDTSQVTAPEGCPQHVSTLGDEYQPPNVVANTAMVSTGSTALSHSPRSTT
jgi:hypothetical protein